MRRSIILLSVWFRSMAAVPTTSFSSLKVTSNGKYVHDILTKGSKEIIAWREIWWPKRPAVKRSVIDPIASNSTIWKCFVFLSVYFEQFGVTFIDTMFFFNNFYFNPSGPKTMHCARAYRHKKKITIRQRLRFWRESPRQKSLATF